MPRRAARFTGQVAVVTGGGSGIGRATALRLARGGAKVHVADVRREPATEVAAEIAASGADSVAHEIDVSDAEQVTGLADAVYAADGRCDVLHNNAGVGIVGAIEDLELEDWRRVIDVNLMGVIHGVHAFVPRMLGQPGTAHIVNTASLAGLVAWPTAAPYFTSKHAVVGLTQVLDAELAPRGIRAHVICPGAVDTPIMREAVMRGGARDQRTAIAGFIARFGTDPENVADAVVDAIAKNTVIRPVPRLQTTPAWLLHRAAPTLSLRLGRTASRFARAHH